MSLSPNCAVRIERHRRALGPAPTEVEFRVVAQQVVAYALDGKPKTAIKFARSRLDPYRDDWAEAV